LRPFGQNTDLPPSHTRPRNYDGEKMTTGRRPKPTALKLIAGNPGKRPLNAAEPDAGECSMVPPAALTEATPRHWARLAPMLAGSGVLKHSDRDILATYCEGYAAFVASAHDGKLNITLIGQLRQMLGEMGMTPAARARIVTDKKPNDGTEKKTRFFAV